MEYKELSREDIESLGFKVKIEPYRWQFGNGVLNLTTAIYTKDEGVPQGRITISDQRDDHIYFDGTVKNKSELRKVLSMLGFKNK